MIISIGGPIPRVISIGIVAPGGVPVTGVEKIRRAEHEHDVVVVVVMPPTLVMPFCVVVAKRGIVLSLPLLAAFNVSALLELHRLRLRHVWLFRNVEVLRLKGLSCRDTSFPWFASNIFCGPISIRNLTFALCLAVFGGFVRLVSATLCFAVFSRLISVDTLTFALCLAVFGGLVRLVSATLCFAVFSWLISVDTLTF